VKTSIMPRGALHAQDRRSQGWAAKLPLRDASIPLPREWKRENLRAVLFVQEKKSRRILWRSRDPHRTINLEAFPPNFRFASKIVLFRNQTFSGTINLDRRKSYSGRRLFPAIKSVSVNNQTCLRRSTGTPEGNAGQGSFLEVIVGRRTNSPTLPRLPLAGSASARNPQ